MAECGGRTWPRSAPLRGDYSYLSKKDRQETRKLPQYNGYCVQFECIEGLLCDVVIADVILQGQVELVLLVDQVEARVRVHLVRVPQPPVAAALPASETCHVSKDDVSPPDPPVPAPPVHVHPDQLREPPHVAVPPTLAVAVRHEPDHGCAASGELTLSQYSSVFTVALRVSLKCE